MSTELETVNKLLRLLGAPPVGDLLNQQPNVAAVVEFLDDARISILKKDTWWFNTDYNFEIAPDITTKELALPLTTIQAIVTSHHGIVKRGDKLYNTHTQSYQHDHNVFVELIVDLPFDQLDDSPQKAIRYFAGAQICADVLEDSTKEASQTRLYVDALTDMKKMNLKVKRLNRLQSPQVQRLRSGVRPYRRF